MKFREWSQRILWFMFGAVSVGLLIFVSTSYGKKSENNLLGEQRPDIQQQVDSLQQQVNAMKKDIGGLWEALHKKEDRTAPDRSRN